MHEQVTYNDAYLMSVIEKTTVKSKSYAPVLAWRHNIPNEAPQPSSLRARSVAILRLQGGRWGAFTNRLAAQKGFNRP